MKRVSVYWLCLIILALGCQQSDYQASIEPLVIKGVKNKSKVLTVFYTRTGNTRLVAETIRNEFDCDLQEIKDLKDRTGIKGFMVGMIDVKTKKSTRINPEKLALDEYDLIIICSPTWEPGTHSLLTGPRLARTLRPICEYPGASCALSSQTHCRVRPAAPCGLYRGGASSAPGARPGMGRRAPDKGRATPTLETVREAAPRGVRGYVF